MGLDTYIYRGWQDEIDSYYDIKTKQRTIVPREGIEVARFRKNYVFMEWMEKHLGFKMQDQEHYVLYEDDVNALLKDCELVIDLVTDFDENDNTFNIPNETLEQIIKIFPQNNWNKEDFYCWEKGANSPTLIPHKFGVRDIDDIKQIYNAFENIIDKYVDKVIVYNSW
jgi:hypothetical protein